MRCEHVNEEKHIVLVLGNDHSKAGHLFVWRNAAQWTLNNHLSESREAPKDLWKRQSNKSYLLPKGSEAKNHTLHKTVCTSEMCRRAEILLPLFSCCLTIVTEPWWKRCNFASFYHLKHWDHYWVDLLRMLFLQNVVLETPTVTRTITKALLSALASVLCRIRKDFFAALQESQTVPRLCRSAADAVVVWLVNISSTANTANL